MKQVMMVAILLIASVFSIGQVKQVVNKTTPQTKVNPIKMVYHKDAIVGDEFLLINKSLLILSSDQKRGFRIKPDFSLEDGKWVYSGLSAKVALGSCDENDEIYFLFEDGTRLKMVSWNKFNCDGNAYFDFDSEYQQGLKKRLKAIKMINGRTFDSVEKVLTTDFEKDYFINCFKAFDDYTKSKK